jgi:drug/metabolite transporter (DMT)-like permease
MSPVVIVLIVTAALAHAIWNLLSKQAAGAGAARFVWLMSAAGSVLYAPAVAVAVASGRSWLSGPAWVFMAGTGVLQAGYFLLLQSGYRLGDLSLVYPVCRGTGALLAAVAGIVLLGERPGPAAIAGILLVVAGVMAIGIPGRASATPAVTTRTAPATPPAATAAGFAMLTGVFIASYTLWDKHAVSALRIPPLVQGYASLAGMSVLLAPLALRDPRRLRQEWRSCRTQVLGAAVLSPLAYILVLIALSFTTVSAVAPAREVSVLFGVLLGRRLLHEGSLARRLAAAAAIAAGILALALG